MPGAVTQWLGIWASDMRRVPGGICVHPWRRCLAEVASRARGMAPTYQRCPWAGTAGSLFRPASLSAVPKGPACAREHAFVVLRCVTFPRL